MRRLLFTLVMLIFGLSSFATTYYSWNAAGPGTYTWNPLTIWNSSRTGGGSTPANLTTSGDVFVVQNGYTITVSSTTNASPGAGVKVQIESGGTVTATSAMTFNATATFQIDNGGTYNHSHTGSISNVLAGTEIMGATSNFNVTAASSITNGTTVSSPGLGNFTYSSSGTMQCNAAFPDLQGNLTVNPATAGTLRLNASTAGRTTINIGGNLTVSNLGTLDWGNGSVVNITINLGGDLTLTATGTTTTTTPLVFVGTGGVSGTPVSANLNFTKSGTQNFTCTNSTMATAASASFRQFNFTVNSGSTLNMGTNLMQTATATTLNFTLSSGAGIILGDAGGIVAAGTNATTGNIRTSAASTRSFSTGANYTYNSSAANQVTGTGLPATVNTLTINNTFGGTGVTLTNSVSTSTLTLTAGRLATGANTVTVSATGGLTTGGSTNYVNGTLIRAVAAGVSSSINFPVGDASNYAPVSLDFSAGNAAGNVTASTSIPGAAPAVGSLISQTNYINRNWTLAFSASPVYSAFFTYKNPGDVVGTPDLNNLRIGKLTSGVWSNPSGVTGSPNVLTPTLTSGGTFSFGDVAYTITSSAGANGTIAPNGSTLVTTGGSQTYTITPAACYSIASLTVDGSPASLTTGSFAAGGTYVFSSVTADHTISATFVQNTYTITVTSGSNGSITPGTGSVNCGDNATYTITPDACYSIASLTVDGSPASLTTGSFAAGGTYVFSNVTAAHTISATFSFNTYAITVTSGSNGSVTPGTGSVNCGDNATYTITPDACYSIASLTVDGSPASLTTGSFAAGGTYVFSNVTATHTISATFSLNTYTITVTQGSNGTIAPGTGSVNCGDNATYTITPDACYSIADVVVDGSSVGVVSSYTFPAVSASHTITASFVQNTYTITVTSGTNGSVTPGTGSVNCGDNATYTVTPDPGYLVSDVTVDGTPNTALTTGSYATGGTYVFSNVTAAHSISATFVLNCVNVSITNVTASNPGPLCSGQTTNLTANGVSGTNAVVNWWTGPGGTGVNVGTGTTLNGVGANTYYARVTGDCGTPAEASITINSVGNTFSGTGNWSDNARWSCGAPPSSGDAVTIAAGANATLDVNFTVSGSLTMTATSTLTVNPTRTLSVDVAATANFNGQSVTFKSDATGTASLGQVNGTLSGATNVTVERYIRNNGFRSWRLLSVPVTSSQTIRQAWQEGDANPLPKQNNVAGYGTQITGVFTTQAAATAAGFDSTSVQAGMLRWNGSAWSNITSTNQSINNFSSYFLYIRGDRSLTVTGATSSSNATTLRTKGTVYTGDQVNSIGANAFALVPNLYPSAINFTGLTLTGGVSNLFYIWDSKKLNGNSLGAYQTFSGTNGFLCLLSGGSYTLGQPNTTIESGQSFFVTSTTAGTVTLKESAKISGTNGSLGFRPSGPLSKIDTRLLNTNSEMIDANAVVFNSAYSKAIADEDAPKLGNPGVNFAIESNSKLLAIEGTAPVKAGDIIQYRMWNLDKGTYQLEIVAQNMAAGTEATLEDSYLKTATPVNMSSNTTVSFTVDQNAASSAANRFRLVFGKVRETAQQEATFTVAPNPIENGTMNVQFQNQKAGRYSVRLISADGRTVLTRTLSHAGGNANQSISLPAGITSGTYTVEITSAGNSRSTQTVLVSRK